MGVVFLAEGGRVHDDFPAKSTTNYSQKQKPKPTQTTNILTIHKCVCIHMYICSLGSHCFRAHYIRCTSNRTVNIADAGTVYSLYTSLLCKLVLCVTYLSLSATTVPMATNRLTLGCRKTPSLVISTALGLRSRASPSRSTDNYLGYISYNQGLTYTYIHTVCMCVHLVSVCKYLPT